MTIRWCLVWTRGPRRQGHENFIRASALRPRQVPMAGSGKPAIECAVGKKSQLTTELPVLPPPCRLATAKPWPSRGWTRRADPADAGATMYRAFRKDHEVRRIVAVSSIAGLAVAGMLTAGAGAAYAAMGPAPQCTSASSQLSCLAPVPVSLVNWTVTLTVNGETITLTSPPRPTLISGACGVSIVYKYSVIPIPTTKCTFTTPGYYAITCSR